MRALNTIVQAESRSRCWRVRKTSATPASPECVATRIVSTYLDLGAASYANIDVRMRPISRFLIPAYLQLCGPFDRLLEVGHDIKGSRSAPALPESEGMVGGRASGRKSKRLESFGSPVSVTMLSSEPRGSSSITGVADGGGLLGHRGSLRVQN